MKQTWKELWRTLGRAGSVLSRRDLVPKLFSLLMAVVLWTYIGSTKLAEVDYRISIDFRGQPASLVMTQQNLKSVTLHLNGKKEDINNFNIKNIKASVNLEGAREGENQRFPIIVSKQDVPESIRVNLSRKYVTISFEKKSSRRVPVDPVLADNIREGLIAGPVTVKPDFVIVSGEQSRVLMVESVRTEPISFGPEAGRQEREVALDRTGLKNMELNVTSVKAVIPVFEMDNVHRVDVPVVLKNARQGFRYEPDRKRIKLFVKSANPVGEGDCEATIDLGKVNLSLLDARKEIFANLRVTASIRGGKEGLLLIMAAPQVLGVKVTKE